jgi:Glycosyl hydrolase family 47
MFVGLSVRIAPAQDMRFRHYQFSVVLPALSPSGPAFDRISKGVKPAKVSNYNLLDRLDWAIRPCFEMVSDNKIASAANSFVLVLTGMTLLAAQGCKRSGDEAHAQQVTGRVKAEFLHAWNNYERYAWGHDALKPLSRVPHDWYGQSLLMTPVDALDTLILMKLDREAAKARELIVSELSFDRDIYVKNFEITIRLLGGLLSSYQLTGDKRLLDLADDLGTRLLPAFNSPTGLPYVFVNLRTGAVRDPVSNPAETGTLLLEFGTLSKLTGKPVFYEKAKRALVETYQRRSSIGLVGSGINVETGAWTDNDSHVSGGIDSYYEYLWKGWLLFGDKDCLEMWNASIPAVHKYLADEPAGELWYGHADMATGKRTDTTYGALDAFFPALLALSGDIPRARRLQASSFKMWNLHGIEPEVIDYKTMRVVATTYHLRPEIVESTYYLHHYTGDEQYRKMGETIFDDFVKYCRTESGYAALADVVAKTQRDEMESFALAETFKYFYLLFAPANTLEFDKVVFNTEAHPLRRTWPML